MGRGSKVDQLCEIFAGKDSQRKETSVVYYIQILPSGAMRGTNPPLLPPYVRPEFDSQGRPLEVGIQGYPMSK